jgi:predicted dehydrogenase
MIHNSHDYIVMGLIIFMIGWTYTTFWEIFDVRERLEKAHPDPQLPPWSDMKIMFTAVFITMCMHRVLKYFLEEKVSSIFKGYNMADHEMRTSKTLEMIYGIFYYGSTSIWAYYTYWGSPNIPWTIGGTADGLYMIEDWPVMKVPMY